MENLFPKPGMELRRSIDDLCTLIDHAFPLPARFRGKIARDVAELSRLLTSERNERDGGYLGKPAQRSAYLRFFLPWNVYRLSRLLPGLPLTLRDGDRVLDLGSGPLTLPIALWLSRPETRRLSLEICCLDKTPSILEAGKTLFAALSSRDETPWKLRLIKGTLGTKIEGPKAALLTASNFFNELCQNSRETPELQGDRYGRLLSSLARDDGSVLVMEPGIPSSGHFISALRSSLLALGRLPLAPCTHGAICPLPQGRRGSKWCHFAFDTESAPESLHRLSEAAGIPKKRATLSFLLAGPRAPDTQGVVGVRILSDAFPVEGGHSARYGCCSLGLVLVEGTRNAIEGLVAGSICTFEIKDLLARRDPKSGCPVFPWKV